ncbi:MAG: hypothetical protein WCW54_00705 [Candidatus Paceibacterota bacterium]
MRKPFYESILSSLHEVMNLEQLKVLAKLIIETEIPKEHRDVVAEAFLLAQACIRYAGGEILVDIVISSLKEENLN